jgi:tetratricopeptide (TPR) repeat protein
VELSPNEEQPPLLLALEEVYTQAERWADLAVVLHHHASVAPDEPERAALDARRVRVLTHRLATPVLAIEAAQAALARHGRSPALLAALAEAARAAGDAALLADTLAEQAAISDEPSARDRLLAEAAALHRQRGEVGRAQTLARALTHADVAPDHRLVLAELIDDPVRALALGRAAANELPAGPARTAAWRLVLGRARELGDEAAERDALRGLWRDGAADEPEQMRLLALFEAAGDSDEAAELLHQLVVTTIEAAGDPAPLLARLRNAARAAAGATRLADGLTRAAASQTDDDQAAAWLREAASLRTGLDDVGGAAEALLAALARRPGDEALMAEVETVLGDLGARGRLRAALERHLATKTGAARLPTLRKLMRLCEELGDDDALHEHAAETRRLEPAAAARVNLGALVRAVATPPRASDEDRGVAIARAEARLRSLPADDVRSVRAARRRLGELYREAGRLGDAFAELAAVLSEEPSNVPVLRALVDVAELDGRWLDAAQLIERLSHLVTAPGQRATLLYRAGEIYLEHLGNREAATTCYLKAVDLDHTHAPTLRRLVDYFFREGDDLSVAEMAAALDGKGQFAVPATRVGTRARAALATAITGDLRCAARLAAALDGSAGVAALAHVAVERLAGGEDAATIVQALRLLGDEERLAAVRGRLRERGSDDPTAATLAARLDPPTS